MIKTQNQKFVFTPIQKTESTSMREILSKNYNCVEPFPKPTSLMNNRTCAYRTSACRLKTYFEESKTTGDPQRSWNCYEYFKFIFVRNPFTCMISNYSD